MRGQSDTGGSRLRHDHTTKWQNAIMMIYEVVNDKVANERELLQQVGEEERRDCRSTENSDLGLLLLLGFLGESSPAAYSPFPIRCAAHFSR